MKNKSCGTCAHCADRHGPRDAMANSVCLRMGCLIVDASIGNCSGLYYDERVDSVEQVLVEMMSELEDGIGGEICSSCVGNDENCHGDWICAKLQRFMAPFRDRLKMLGVEV